MNNSTVKIRQTFLNFFKSKGHKVINSSSLIPKNDQTLLFTNAGMNQFKNIFLGYEKYKYSRVTTAQRCVRAGGKHNDLDNVGYTARHHTFFEMLGNFSFGDYFKELAIIYAWELLTSVEWFNLPTQRLWVTVYKNDTETYNIWKNIIKIEPNHIILIGDYKDKIYESDNFWQMGDVGPCGPCSEIFYDYGKHIKGGIPGSKDNGERYIEIWNIVFMQFNRQIDGTMKLLPKPSVDTGMGLERMASVCQNVNSNYEIDLFKNLIKKISIIININYLDNKSLYVIADHIRSCSFLIADGVIPSNENRGYVLRRIIRRAIRHGNILGIKEIFFYKLVTPLIEVMSDENSNILKYKKHHIEEIIKIEEEQFTKTLERGLNILNNKLSLLKDNLLDGKTIFNLYDTFGFPIDLTLEICREKNIKFDKNGFEIEMSKQRNQARKINNIIKNNNKLSISSDYILKNNNYFLTSNLKSIFKGYNTLNLISNIKLIFFEGKKVNQLYINQYGIIILDQTSFYNESGGQLGDIGILEGQNGVFDVYETKKNGETIYHIGKLKSGYLNINDSICTKVNQEYRNKISCNHSAIHLLHATLREILGKHITQKGSLISDKSLRFDFSHKQPLTKKEINIIDNIINSKIRQNLLISTNFVKLKDAKDKGAIALFDEKYDDNQVRMVSIGNYSVELCCGTHVNHTGNIGFFSIICETGISSGIRRIEAVTGENAVFQFHTQKKYLYDISGLLKINNFNNLNKKINSILLYINKLENKLNILNKKQIIQDSLMLVDQSIDIKGTKLLIHHFNETEIKTLREMITFLKKKFISGIIIFSTIIKDKVSLLVGVTKNLTNIIQANILISEFINQNDIKGGGKPDMAIAVGIEKKILKHIINRLKILISSKL